MEPIKLKGNKLSFKVQTVKCTNISKKLLKQQQTTKQTGGVIFQKEENDLTQAWQYALYFKLANVFEELVIKIDPIEMLLDFSYKHIEEQAQQSKSAFLIHKAKQFIDKGILQAGVNALESYINSSAGQSTGGQLAQATQVAQNTFLGDIKAKISNAKQSLDIVYFNTGYNHKDLKPIIKNVTKLCILVAQQVKRGTTVDQIIQCLMSNPKLFQEQQDFEGWIQVLLKCLDQGQE